MFTVRVIDREFRKYEGLLDIMFRQRYEIFCREFGFAEGDEENGVEIDEYDQNRSCAYFFCFDEDEETLGASSRLIIKKPGVILPIEKAGFKLDVSIETNSAEISRFIVDRNLRSNPMHHFTLILGYNMYVYVKERSIEWCYALMEEEIFRFITEVIHCPFERIGESKEYMGGTLIPSQLKVEDMTIFG